MSVHCKKWRKLRCSVNLILDQHPGSSSAETRVKCQRDWILLTPGLETSRDLMDKKSYRLVSSVLGGHKIINIGCQICPSMGLVNNCCNSVGINWKHILDRVGRIRQKCNKMENYMYILWLTNCVLIVIATNIVYIMPRSIANWFRILQSFYRICWAKN